MARIIIVWGLWGPYHCRRFEVFRDYAAGEGHEVIGISLFSASSVNQWRTELLPQGVMHFDLGKDEAKFPFGNLGRLMQIPSKTKPDVALLPSYGYWSLALNVAVRLAGGRVVMMNETHGGTARATGFKAAIKRRVVASFHGGLVGGAPHVRYFASQGLPEHKIFTGYDAVDNDYFARRTEEVRGQRPAVRSQYVLPEHYFLSLGRFVPKKNLETLIRAYRLVLNANPDSQTHLVMVGSGEEGAKLRMLCRELSLPIYDKTALKIHSQKSEIGNELPGVHFYGFRQIEQNPVFYALADVFILPSLWEEWGLVVNEAMASGLPVVVSETAGCAEDLLEKNSAIGGDASEIIRMRRAGLRSKLRRNGFVFDPKSAEELSGALTLLASLPEMRTAMGESSRSIVNKFSCENFARNAMHAAQAAFGPRANRENSTASPKVPEHQTD